MHYLYARYWRGAMNVDSMRLFSSYDQMFKYVKTQITNALDANFFRAYEFVDDKQRPKLINTRVIKELGKLP